MTKSTVAIVQVATDDGSNKQHMIIFEDGAIYRRSITATNRSRWRKYQVADLATWAAGYINLAKAEPQAMSVTHGFTLMEVTADEAAEATAGTLARNVNLRFSRVLDGIDADPSTCPPMLVTVEEYLTEWTDAQARDDDDWIDQHVHPDGTATRWPTPDPDPSTPVLVPTISHGWTYPETVDGYITRPNGERYKVRELDGVPDVTILRDSRPRREHVFLFGVPGTGKTALADSAFGTDLVTMLGTEDTEVGDFTGGYGPRGGGTYGWSDGALVEAMERGVPLLIDEIGVIAPKVLTTTFSVMDGRDEIRITANPDRGIVIAKEGFFVIACTNPDAPGVRLSEPLLSRFGVHIEVGTDYAMMRELGVPEVLVTAAENLETRRKEGAIGWAPQARELLRAKAQWDTRGELFAVRNLISSAPYDSREQAAEVLSSTFGTKTTGLVL